MKEAWSERVRSDVISDPPPRRPPIFQLFFSLFAHPSYNGILALIIMAGTAGTGTVPAPSAMQTSNDISIAQRMVSATAGSILTSLLGTYSGR